MALLTGRWTPRGVFRNSFSATILVGVRDLLLSCFAIGNYVVEWIYAREF